MKRRFLSLTVLATLALTASVASITPAIAQTGTAPKPAAPKSIVNTTPDGALRGFMIAMITQNKTALRKLIVPVSDADLSELTGGTPPPADFRKQAIAQITSAQIVLLQPGEKITTPDGKTITVPKSADGKTSVYAQPIGSPLPFPILKTNGKWLVDTRPILAARSAAKAAKKP